MIPQPMGSAEVDKFDVIIALAKIFFEHNVFRFDVNVRNTDGVKIIGTLQQPHHNKLDDIAPAADTTPLHVIDVRVQRGMEPLKSDAEVLVPLEVSVNNHTVMLAVQLCL
jgi:hypothetical protein